MNEFESLIKNNKFNFIKLNSVKEALDNFNAKTGAENELKSLLRTDNFALDHFCISSLAYKLIEDEKNNDPDFNEYEAKISVNDNIYKIFSMNFNLDQNWLDKLSPSERSIAYSLMLIKDNIFNESCSKKGMNEKLAVLLMNGCLISSEYEAVKLDDNLEETRKRYENELKNQEKESQSSDFVEKISYKLFLKLIKNSLNQNVVNLALKSIKISNCL